MMKMVDRTAPKYGSKLVSELTDIELDEALHFVNSIYNHFRDSAPPQVWGYFASVRSDLTIEWAKRMMPSDHGNR